MLYIAAQSFYITNSFPVSLSTVSCLETRNRRLCTLYNRQTTTLVEDFVEYNVNFYPCVIRQHESISKFFLHVALLRYTLPTVKYNKNVVNIHSSLSFLTKKLFLPLDCLRGRGLSMCRGE